MVGMVLELWVTKGRESASPRCLHSPAHIQDCILGIPLLLDPRVLPRSGGEMPQPFLGLTPGPHSHCGGKGVQRVAPDSPWVLGSPQG